MVALLFLDAVGIFVDYLQGVSQSRELLEDPREVIHVIETISILKYTVQIIVCFGGYDVVFPVVIEGGDEFEDMGMIHLRKCR